jgi:hypothetical protein
MCSLLTGVLVTRPAKLHEEKGVSLLPPFVAGSLEDRTMATILSFLKDANVFDPNDIQAMSMALDDVCWSLDVVDGPGREVIAERIVDLARNGVRSPTVLRDRVLRDAGQAHRIGLDG